MAEYEKKMNRRDMLREMLSKGRDTTLKVTTQAVGEYAELSNVLKEYRWEQVNLSSELTDKPRQVMYKSKPYFVAKLEDEVIALEAICPLDQQMIFWQNHTGSYNCLMCRQQYDIWGQAIDSSEDTNVEESTETVGPGPQMRQVMARLNEGNLQFRVDA